MPIDKAKFSVKHRTEFSVKMDANEIYDAAIHFFPTIGFRVSRGEKPNTIIFTRGSIFGSIFFFKIENYKCDLTISITSTGEEALVQLSFDFPWARLGWGFITLIGNRDRVLKVNGFKKFLLKQGSEPTKIRDFPKIDTTPLDNHCGEIMNVPCLGIPVSKKGLIVLSIFSILVGKYLNVYLAIICTGFAFSLTIQNLNPSLLTIGRYDQWLNDYYSLHAFGCFIFVSIIFEYLLIVVTLAKSGFAGLEKQILLLFIVISVGVTYGLILDFIDDRLLLKIEDDYGSEAKIIAVPLNNYLIIASSIFAIAGFYINFLLLLIVLVLYVFNIQSTTKKIRLNIQNYFEPFNTITENIDQYRKKILKNMILDVKIENYSLIIFSFVCILFLLLNLRFAKTFYIFLNPWVICLILSILAISIAIKQKINDRIILFFIPTITVFSFILFASFGIHPPLFIFLTENRSCGAFFFDFMFIYILVVHIVGTFYSIIRFDAMIERKNVTDMSFLTISIMFFFTIIFDIIIDISFLDMNMGPISFSVLLFSQMSFLLAIMKGFPEAMLGGIYSK